MLLLKKVLRNIWILILKIILYAPKMMYYFMLVLESLIGNS